MKNSRYYKLPGGKKSLDGTQFDWVHIYNGFPVPPTYDGSYNYLIWELIQTHQPNHLLISKYYENSFKIADTTNQTSIIQIEFKPKIRFAKWIKNTLSETPKALGKSKNFIDEAIKCISETKVQNIIVWGDMEPLPYLRWAFPEKSITFAQRVFEPKPNYQLKHYEYCDYLLTQTKGTTKNIFEKESQILATTVAIPNGVDLNKYHPASPHGKSVLRNQLNIAEDKFVILFPSHLKISRGTNYIYDWIRETRKSIPNALFVVTGKNFLSERGNSKALLNSFNESNNCIWLQGVPHDEMVKWYQVSDVALIPSVWPEGMSMASIEAMASGLPVIATKHGAFKDYIFHQYNGWLCSPENIFHEGLAALQKLNSDTNLLRNLSENALSYARTRLSRERSLSNFKAFFDKRLIDIDSDLSIPN